MIDPSLLQAILFPKTAPNIPNLREAVDDRLFADGLAMGTLLIGKQGSGKTSFLAKHIVDYFKSFPGRAIFILDWSGSITNRVIGLILQESGEIREKLLEKLIYDELGNPDLVVPLPEFSRLYGGSYEEQIERVRTNWVKLTEYLTREATILGGVAIKGLAPAFFKVLVNCMEDGEDPWQVTEIGKFIDDPKIVAGLFRRSGAKIPARTREFITRRFLNVKGGEQELRSYSLSELLFAIESPAAFPRLGYPKPGWTPREAINRGLMVLVNGARLINQGSVQNYLFTQVYSLIMQEVNKRTPANPNDKPVALVMDEVYSLFQIPGMAKEVGMIAPIYRSRKLELYIVIQALWQLDKALREQVWSLGNVVTFGVENFKEAFEIAHQLFQYDPLAIKPRVLVRERKPITEHDRGQYLEEANWIQNLANRECVLRRYVTESVRDDYIRHLSRTTQLPEMPLLEAIEKVKLRLLKKRAVKVSVAIEAIEKRRLPSKPQSSTPAHV